jgi:hypothetical protein
MVITWPATAPQRRRTIQRKFVRAADSTLVSGGMQAPWIAAGGHHAHCAPR